MDGKSADSRAVTWSIGSVVMRYVAVIVLTRPTLGNAATTVPPFMSTSLIVRSSTSATKSALGPRRGDRLSRFANATLRDSPGHPVPPSGHPNRVRHFRGGARRHEVAFLGG